MKFLRYLSGGLLLLVISSCATQQGKTAATGSRATCYVCLHNRDLGCINIRVKETTPHLVHEGTDYYFCSEGCRETFAKNPASFLPKQ